MAEPLPLPGADAGPDLHDGVAPLADLLFAVATIVIALLVAVLPTLATLPRADADRSTLIDAAARRTGARLVLLAAADGVTVADRRVADAPPRTIPTAALLDDAALAALLAGAATGPPPALLVEDRGAEAAFVLEGLLAAAGIPAVDTVRIPSDEAARP